MTNASCPEILTIESLKALYAGGVLTPAQVIQEIITRVHEDAEMNIWITPPRLEIIQSYVERLMQMNPEEYPLWGIPFAIKDNIDMAGVPTTAGCDAYAYTPERHATIVERLIDAGAIPLGKTNLDQFATGLIGTRSPYGETHNALRPELISGGSSSGSAVAVARGHAAFSLGTDTAGSGRVPAALNRLVGYKPSLGTWPSSGLVPACASLDCITVFSHSIEEALTVDSIVRGKDTSDPWSRDIPLTTQHPMPVKIALPKQSLQFYGPYASAYEQAWQAVIARWKTLSVEIEYVDISVFEQAAALLYDGPWIAERWATMGSFIDSNPGSGLLVTEQILRSGDDSAYSAASVFRAIHKLQVYKMQAKQLLKDAVLVLPTCGGTWTREQVAEEPFRTNRLMGQYTNHCNLLDLSAIAIPAGDAAADTPFGITLFAPSEHEGWLSGAAEEFVQQLDKVQETAVIVKQDYENASRTLKPELSTTLIAVCGLHMRGLALEPQMQACGARFIKEAQTAACYQMIQLPTVPAKPGLIKGADVGASIQLELWEMPLEAFGTFAASIPAPLGIGKVELQDGSEVPGFVCEAYAAAGAKDITAHGGWRQAMAVLV
ncbi:allophanate hydrolase [Paenibacillus sp. UNC451MF]|uniref:allophanate hydrolase n=1 Tax=Paenibacillus sp. UNC451MF TaxID=1449063 RepID=UPI0004906822|nr:allophanate hydrolase [Paenibacillus sp. UNC451MF]